MRNLLTDVPGLAVGNAASQTAASGVTALVFDEPATASIAVGGGAPGTRDTALLAPEMSVEKIDALVLSGGSAFGLDAMGGAMACLYARGRGFAVGTARVPIVPGAILFDLLNGGDKAWGRMPPYWELGYAAADAAAKDFALGTAGAGYGATTADLKGGLGSASIRLEDGITVGALAAVNAVGSAVIAGGPHFRAAAHEMNGEFGGLGLPADTCESIHPLAIKGGSRPARENTTIAIVATDAALTKPQAARMARMAQDGVARALRPSHAAMDGDIVFAASTGQNHAKPDLAALTAIGTAAADCLARAIARGVYEAEALPFANALPCWKTLFAR